MLSFACERAAELLKAARSAVLATAGPAGVRAGEFPCEAVELDVYLLLPRTSDHLFNLEQNGRLALHTPQWELTGRGRALSPGETWPHIFLLSKSDIGCYALVKVVPERLQVLSAGGWGAVETIDLAGANPGI